MEHMSVLQKFIHKSELQSFDIQEVFVVDGSMAYGSLH